MKDNERNRRIITILGIFTIIFTVMGGSLAYWTWSSNETSQTNVAFSIDSDFSCSADGGGNITETDAALQPTSKCTDSNYAIQRTIKVTPEIKKNDLSINMNVWLNINSMDSELSNSEHLRYALTTNQSSCTEDVISEGSFKGRTTGNIVPLITGNEYTGTAATGDTYYLYIWLDAEETNNNTQGKSFDLSLGGECTDTPNIPNSPELMSEMIPVTIADDGMVTTIAEDDPNWYDYDNQKWANVVLVSETNRQTYLDNLSSNMEVSEEDILAYYVWIPRFKYRVWTKNTNITNSPQTIDIVFQDKDDPFVVNNIEYNDDGNEVLYDGTVVNTYTTHPAFWENSWADADYLDKGELMSGIWVGKFETSVDPTSECYTSPSVDNCNHSDHSIRILPNVYSLRYQNISNQFYTAQNSDISDHMMKNSEWGAVAYLSHSKYGINDEVRINNSTKKTGCGAAEENGEATSGCEIAYGSGVSSYPQSTTGNITGVFDMSGGTREYVMGNYNDSAGNTDWDEYDGEIYTVIGRSTNDCDYYYSVSLTRCVYFSCFGHSLHETTSWYNDNYAWFTDNKVWLRRGGRYDEKEKAGLFNYESSDGGAYQYTFRLVRYG